MEQDRSYMLKRIGMFAIDDDVSADHLQLQPINDKKLLDFFANAGIKKTFKGETFYQSHLLSYCFERESLFNIVGAIDNKIYKIYIKFLDDSHSKCISLREALREYFSEFMSPQEFKNPQIIKVEYGQCSIWFFDWGNILLEEMDIIMETETAWSTAIGITSKAVKSAKKAGFFDKLFN
jgi:hypothetical protein